MVRCALLRVWLLIKLPSSPAGTSFLIEDVACPVDKLADMTTDLVEMFEKYGYKDASCFGHALEGNLHLVFSQVGNAPDHPCQAHLATTSIGMVCWLETRVVDVEA